MFQSHKPLYLSWGGTDLSSGNGIQKSCNPTPTTYEAPPRINFCPSLAGWLRHFGTDLNTGRVRSPWSWNLFHWSDPPNLHNLPNPNHHHESNPPNRLIYTGEVAQLLNLKNLKSIYFKNIDGSQRNPLCEHPSYRYLLFFTGIFFFTSIYTGIYFFCLVVHLLQKYWRLAEKSPVRAPLFWVLTFFYRYLCRYCFFLTWNPSNSKTLTALRGIPCASAPHTGKP